MLIIFDLDDTLVDTSIHITPRKLEEALQAMLQNGLVVDNYVLALETLFSFYYSEESSIAALRAFLVQKGCLDRFFSVGLAKLQEELSAEQELSLAVPYALDVLEMLKHRHRLALVTIGVSNLQFSKLKKAGIDPALFSKITIIEGKNKKPSYQTLMREFQLASQEVIVCGDRTSIDLAPAKELNCHTVLLTRGRGKHARESALSSGMADYAIEDWSEFIPLIEHLEHITLRHS